MEYFLFITGENWFFYCESSCFVSKDKITKVSEINKFLFFRVANPMQIYEK